MIFPTPRSDRILTLFVFEYNCNCDEVINQSIKFIIISVAHYSLQARFHNSSVAFKFKNTSAIYVDTTEITIVDETRECLSRQMMLTYSVW